MSLAFLVPLFLLGIAGVVVPILIHLTRRQRRNGDSNIFPCSRLKSTPQADCMASAVDPSFGAEQVVARDPAARWFFEGRQRRGATRQYVRQRKYLPENLCRLLPDLIKLQRLRQPLRQQICHSVVNLLAIEAVLVVS